MKITVGADPELFLTHVKSLNFISSIGKFGGSKRNPQYIGHGCSIQEDNVALEFNIPPSQSKRAFVESINYCLDQLAIRAKELDLQLTIISSANFKPDQLNTREALVFGCDPDKNAWTKKINPAPYCKDKTLRSAGGHIHVGCRDFAGYEIARAMDLFLGVPSVLMDDDTNRRLLYGKAGCYRNKPYGMEYRTLSNYWLKSDNLKEWVYEQTQKAIDFLKIGNRLSDEEGDDIQDCINNSKKHLTQTLAKRYSLELGTVI